MTENAIRVDDNRASGRYELQAHSMYGFRFRVLDRSLKGSAAEQVIALFRDEAPARASLAQLKDSPNEHTHT